MREALTNHLANVTGVSDWNSINFGILPGENPKGYMFLASTSVSNRVRKVQLWAFAIAVSATSLNQLSDTTEALTDKILTAFKNPTGCIEGIGLIELSGNVDVEAPQSYSHQGNQSQTTGFFTAITFLLEIN